MTTEDNALVLVRQLRDRADTRHQHARAALDGEEVRVRRSLPVFSHWSAAARRGLPIVGRLPETLHIVVGRTSGGRSRSGVCAHSMAAAETDIVQAGEFRLTSVARTIVDLAVAAPTRVAVAMADYVLSTATTRHGDGGEACSRDDLLAAWDRSRPFRGHRRALEVIDFADGRAGSLLESVSRVTMHAIGCPRLDLQVPFTDAQGFVGLVDFYWPEFGLIGEADGDLKYLNPAFRGGRSAEQVVLDEKIREDRLRALGLRVVRWRWKTATDARAMRAKLSSAGLPTCLRDSWHECPGLE